MQVLFLTQVLPYPLDAGPKVRAYFTLRHLAARHAVTLVSLVRSSDSPEALAHLRQWCQAVITVPIERSPVRDALALARSLASGRPFLVERDRVPGLHAALRDLAGPSGQTRFDVIHADQLWMAPYALAARPAAPLARPRLVLDQHNAVHLVPRRMAASSGSPALRWLFGQEAARMARYEAAVCREFDRVVVVSAEDGQALLGLYPEPKRPPAFPVIPICIDPAAIEARLEPASQPVILFVAGMHWPPNRDGVLWFAREVLPLVTEAVPGVRFDVVGRQPPPELAALAQAAGAALRAPGYLPDVEDSWRGCRVFVVPLRSGGGLRVKILDAWARGVPVVSTSIGAEGLAHCHGENLLIADTPDAFAGAVRQVLRDTELARRLALGGRAAVEQHYDWRRVYPAWDRIYAD